MSRKLFVLILILLIASVFISGCSGIKDSVDLKGVWYTCIQTNYTTSERHVLTVRDGNFTEVINGYENTIYCNNNPLNETTITGKIQFGSLGDSGFDPGGTDVTWIPDNNDRYGCGIGNPAYTYWRIQNNIGFWLASSPPVCDPNIRGSGLGYYYTKTSD